MTGLPEYVYGSTPTIELLFLEENRSVRDISWATVLQIRFVDPSDDSLVTTKSASFVTDGSDGLIKYKMTHNDPDVTAGDWLVLGFISDGTTDSQYYTSPAEIRVKPSYS